MGAKEANYLSVLAGQDPIVFDILVMLVFTEEQPINWRAMWVLEKVSEREPTLFTNTLHRRLAELIVYNRHLGLQRLCLSILFNLPVDNGLFSVQCINRLFAQMLAPKQPVAIQVLSMKLLAKICTVEPGFIPELLAHLEDVDVSNYSKGYVATRKKIINQLTAKF